THTGSAPQTPIRQPDSIPVSAFSSMSSSVAPGLATSRSPLGAIVTSGLPPRAARAAARPPAPTFGAASASAWVAFTNSRSLSRLRTTQPAASAQTTPRIAHTNALELLNQVSASVFGAYQ